MNPPAPPYPRLAEIKTLVAIEDILARRGLLHTLRRQGERLVGPCPLHHGDSPTAFVVNRTKNVWYCFTRCARGGDVVDLLRALDGSSFAEVARLLEALARPRLASGRPSPAPQLRLDFRPFTRVLPLDHAAPAIISKGIRASTARIFEVGQYHGPGFLHGCLGVRLHDPHGNPLGYAGRRLDPDEARRLGKWKFPTALPARQILYGFHHVRPISARPLVVVECPWGVMRLAQIAVPAVALLGTRASYEQRRLLGLAPALLLLLDGDPAGREGARRLQRELRHHDVRLVDLPDGHDPDDLPDTQLRALVSHFFRPARW